jgi:hypothetical protein
MDNFTVLLRECFFVRKCCEEMKKKCTLGGMWGGTPTNILQVFFFHVIKERKFVLKPTEGKQIPVTPGKLIAWSHSSLLFNLN